MVAGGRTFPSVVSSEVGSYPAPNTSARMYELPESVLRPESLVLQALLSFLSAITFGSDHV